LEGKQKRGGEIEEERGKRRTKTRKTEPATTPSVVEEAIIASAGNNRACSDGGSREDKCGGGKRVGIRDWTKYRGSSKKESFCNGSRSG